MHIYLVPKKNFFVWRKKTYLPVKTIQQKQKNLGVNQKKPGKLEHKKRVIRSHESANWPILSYKIKQCRKHMFTVFLILHFWGVPTDQLSNVGPQTISNRIILPQIFPSAGNHCTIQVSVPHKGVQRRDAFLERKKQARRFRDFP